MDKTEHEKLDRLFKQLADGETPNFLEMMSAISAVSELYPEKDEACEPSLCLTCG